MTEPAPITQAVATQDEWVGRHTGLPNDAYHAGPGISKSWLTRVDQSPAHYRYAKDHPEDKSREAPRDIGGAMDVGTAFHVKVLEPQNWRARVAVKAEGAPAGRSSAEKTYWASWARVNADKAWIRHDQAQAIEEMAESVHDHHLASALLHPELIETEVSYYGIDPDTGVLMRCRVDAEVPLDERTRVVCDLKKTRDASYTRFVKQLHDLWYHVQDRYYRHVMRCAGYDVEKWYFVAVEDTPPYGVNVFELGVEEARIGDILWRKTLDKYAECEKSGLWPCYEQEVRVVNFQPWMLRAPIR